MICILSGALLVGFGFFLFLWSKNLLKSVCGVLYAVFGISLCLVGTADDAEKATEVAAVALLVINLAMFSLVAGLGISKIRSRAGYRGKGSG